MNTIVTAFAFALALGSWPVTQIDVQQAPPAATHVAAPAAGQPCSGVRPQIGEAPAEQLPVPVSPIGTTSAVQITNGPVVENVTDTTAEIAWSTNVNSGTALHYGTDPSHLDQTAGMPWGGLTHRVTIKDLRPNTTYYFRAESGQGQGTGSQAQTAQASFQTKPAGASSQLR